MPTLPPVKRFVTRSGIRIYRIPCQVFAYLSARVYLVLGAGPPTLIDTGSDWGNSLQEIVDGIESIHKEYSESVRLADIGRIVLTHTHPDHVGGLAALHEMTGAEVCLHPLESRNVAACEERAVLAFRRLEAFFRQAGVDQHRRETLNRLNRQRFRSVPVARLLRDGDDLDGLEVVHTPGHSPGHVCLVADEILLCADHILARTVPQQWPESLSPFAGLAHYFDSLEKVQQRDGFELALAGHEPVIEDVHRRIDAIHASHVRRCDRMIDVLQRAGRSMTISELTREMYPHITGSRVMLALTDIGARVEYLQQQGEMAVVNLDEIEREEFPAYQYALA